jgi:hypothetical protein
VDTPTVSSRFPTDRVVFVTVADSERMPKNLSENREPTALAAGPAGVFGKVLRQMLAKNFNSLLIAQEVDQKAGGRHTNDKTVANRDPLVVAYNSLTPIRTETCWAYTLIV